VLCSVLPQNERLRVIVEVAPSFGRVVKLGAGNWNYFPSGMKYQYKRRSYGGCFVRLQLEDKVGLITAGGL
jgi:hypothetical protein